MVWGWFGPGLLARKTSKLGSNQRVRTMPHQELKITVEMMPADSIYKKYIETLLVIVKQRRYSRYRKFFPKYPNHNILVCHEDGRCQQMKVLPEKLSVHLGSYLAVLRDKTLI